MSLTVGELNAFLDLDTGRFDRGLQDGQRRFGGFGSALAGMAKKAAIGTAAALGAGAVAGINSFANLERGMNEVFTLLPGISEDAMGDMTDQVKGFATEFGTLPSEVVPALYQSLSAGIPQGNVFDFLETAQKAATAGVADLETSVSAITGTVNAYGEDVLGAGEASDLMFTAVKQGVTTFGELASSLSNVTPIAAANGVAFGDVTAAIATMTKQGEPTASATTKIRQALVELSDQGSVAGKAFEEVAGKSFRQFIAEGGNMADAMGVMETAAKDNGVSVDQMFGSVEAGSAALMLSGTKAELFSENIASMADSAGATQTAYEQMDQGIGRSFDKIKAAGAVALANVGEALAPLVASVAGFAEDTLPRLAEQIGPMVTNAIAGTTAAIQTAIGFWNQFKVPILAIAAVLAASYIPTLAASATATVISVGKKVKAWTLARGAALKSVATQTAAMVKMIAKYAWMGVQSLLHAAKVAASWVVAMGPVGWVIALVVGLVALIIANWDKVKDWTGRIWTWVSDKVADAWKWIQDKTRAAVDAVVRFFTGLRDDAVRIVTALRDKVVGFFTNLKNRAIAIVTAMVTGYVRFVMNLRDRVVGFVSDLVSRVVGFFGNLRDRAIAIVQTIVSRNIAFWGGLVSTIVGFVTNIRDRVVSIFTGLKDRVVSTITSLMDRVRGVKDTVLGFFAGAGSWLLQAGRNIIQGLIDGIKNMIGNLGSAVSSAVSSVTDRLPWSPAKKGPLASHPPERGGANIIRQLAAGMGGEVGTLATMADRAAAAALPDLGNVRVPRIGAIAGTSSAAGLGAAGGGPSTLVVVDADGQLIGRMRVEAGREVASTIGGVRQHARAY